MQGQRNAVDAFSIETVTVVGDRNELDGGARIGVVTVIQGTFEIALGNGDGERMTVAGDEAWPPSGLVVCAASLQESQSHAAALDALQKQSGKAMLWRRDVIAG